MKDLPTLELSSYGANTIGDRVLANGVADGSTVEKLVIFSTGERQKEAEVISSEKAKVSLKDPRAFIYSLDLTNPLIMTNDTQKRGIWNLAKAEEATLYLDFSGQIPSITDTTPSQLSISQLKKKAQEKKVDLDRDRFSKEWELQKSWTKLASDSTKEIISPKAFNTAWETYSQKENSEPISFYYQYYRAEMEKKIALSMYASIIQIIGQQVSYSFASMLPSGSVTAFSNATIFWQTPYGIFFTAISTVYFPLMSQAWAKQEKNQLRNEVGRGLEYLATFMGIEDGKLLFLVGHSSGPEDKRIIIGGDVIVCVGHQNLFRGT